MGPNEGDARVYKKLEFGLNFQESSNILSISLYDEKLVFGTSDSELILCNANDICNVIQVPLKGNSKQVKKIDNWDEKKLILNGGIQFDGHNFNQLLIESEGNYLVSNFAKKFLNDDIIIYTPNSKFKVFQLKENKSIFSNEYYNPINSNLTATFQSKNQNIWLGTMNGLFKVENYDYKSSFEIYDNKGGSLGRISNISIDTNNIVWVSTIGNGVIGIKENSTDCVSELPNLSSQMVNKVLITNDSILWLATNNGIDVLSYHWDDTLSVKYIRNINNTDGLVSNYVNDLALYNGLIWAATNKGMCRFSPAILESKVPQIPIRITQFDNGDSTFSITNDLNFDYDENDIKISYLGLSFQQQKDKIEYKYRLIKNDNLADAKWYYTDARDQRFNNIPAGNYSFEVTAKNKFKIWTENPAKVFFTIQPRFIDTGLFKGLLLFFTASILVFTYRMQIKRIKRRQYRDKELAEAKQNMQEAELSAIRNQMNPHFVFNSLNSIQNLVFKNDKEGTNYYLSQFSKLMRQSLQFTSLDFITLKKELTFLSNYLELESLRFPEKFEVIFEVSEQINSREILIPSLILQPIVENSIKHGFNNINYKGLIKIKAKLWDENTLYLSVVDNGKGSKASNMLVQANLKEHKSLGIEMVKNRIDLLNRTRFNMKAELSQEITESGYRTIFKMPILFSND